MSSDIIGEQHGASKGRSVVINLRVFIEFIDDAFDFRHQVDVIYADFSKAFNKVDHDLLIQKSNDFNISYDLIKWLHSDLHQRPQFVRFNDVLSDVFISTSGVPQGSHLGHLLSLNFINDIYLVLR